MRRTLAACLVALLTVLGRAVPSYALSVGADSGMDMMAGNVYALASAGGWLYVGGKFSAIRDASGLDRCPADNLVRVDEATGLGDCTFAPSLPGTQVDAVAVMGSFVYVGGDFGLARVNTTTGHLDSTFAPGVGNTVHTVLPARDGSGVYVGGAFGHVNTAARANLAFITTSGALGAWNPGADDVVRRLRWSPAGYIVASGHFEHVGGHFDQSIAEIDPSGAVRSFSANIREVGAMTCFDTAPTSAVIYAACGQKQNFMAAFDATSGAVIWRTHLGGNGESVSLAHVGGHVHLFVGGHFGTRSPTSMPCGSGFIHGILEANPRTGVVNCSWDPELFPDIHNYTGGWVQDAVGGQLWVGGKFGKVSGATHHGLARWTL